jgi:hypothetical protein
MTSHARLWRELVKQVVIVLKYKGTRIDEGNIKDVLGPKWAWKMGRLFDAVRFEVGDWQDTAMQRAIAEHNFNVEIRWLCGRGDPARSCWWHVTEICPNRGGEMKRLEDLNKAELRAFRFQEWSSEVTKRGNLGRRPGVRLPNWVVTAA